MISDKDGVKFQSDQEENYFMIDLCIVLYNY